MTSTSQLKKNHRAAIETSTIRCRFQKWKNLFPHSKFINFTKVAISDHLTQSYSKTWRARLFLRQSLFSASKNLKDSPYAIFVNDKISNSANLCYWLLLRPWINQIAWPNSCKSSCKVTFLFYKMSSWKFEKYNRKRFWTSVNFVWVKILQKILQLTAIVDKFSIFF